ncbi:MAG: hypothetical protein FWD71_22640 [Oscillospiraceae bacterium]|nr:hypothetical protein [Oscillospiraceae bacterium]
MSNINNSNDTNSQASLSTYVSRQIAVYKTDKKLIEFNDKLNAAPITTYAHIHAQADDGEDGRKIYSNIGIVLQDYSNGTGDKTVRVTANISPDEAEYIFSKVHSGIEKFEFASDKIFGQPDENGYSKVTKLKIIRSTVGSDGKPRNYPWYVECENGKGIAEKNKTGGTYCKSQSFISENKVFINLNDLDFFKLMNRVSSYIRIWESQYGASLMITGRNAIEEQASENQQK